METGMSVWNENARQRCRLAMTRCQHGQCTCTHGCSRCGADCNQLVCRGWTSMQKGGLACMYSSAKSPCVHFQKQCRHGRSNQSTTTV